MSNTSSYSQILPKQNGGEKGKEGGKKRQRKSKEPALPIGWAVCILCCVSTGTVKSTKSRELATKTKREKNHGNQGTYRVEFLKSLSGRRRTRGPLRAPPSFYCFQKKPGWWQKERKRAVDQWSIECTILSLMGFQKVHVVLEGNEQRGTPIPSSAPSCSVES